MRCPGTSPRKTPRTGPNDAVVVARGSGKRARDGELLGSGFAFEYLKCGVFGMRRYYFHIKRGQMTVLDQEGVELAELADAEREAVLRALHIAWQHGVKANDNGSIVIADDAWQTVMEVPF